MLKSSKFALFFFCSIFILSSINPTKGYASNAKQKYLAADACYKILRNSPAKMKYRHNWINCIKKYQNISTKFPESGWAPAGMYRAAQLYLQLFKRSRTQSDRQEAAGFQKYHIWH